MNISTSTGAFSVRFGDVRAVEMLAEIGYDALDYSMFSLAEGKGPVAGDDFEEHALRLKETAKRCGVFFNQAHAPFPSYIKGNDEFNEAIVGRLKRSMEVCGILGVKTVIVHPIFLHVGQKEMNLKLYNELGPYAEKYGFKIALENLFGWKDEHGYPAVCGLAEDFAEYVDMFDSRYFTACLDIGHAGVVGENAAHMIRVLGHDRLTALHVHDNDNRYDLHQLPFLHKVNWDEVTKALAEIKYTGDLTFESDSFIMAFPDELSCDASRMMLAVGKYLVKQIGL